MKKSLGMIFMIGLIFTALMVDSQESSAIPVFARKYKTSCFTCHAGYPTLNAFGEAFKNNGYRFPNGEDEDQTKIEQSPLGSESYEKVFPDAPYPADMPGFAPIAFWAVGNLVNYEEKTDADAELLQWGAPGTSRITVMLGGTIGEDISYFALYSPTGTSSVRASWALSPGFLLSYSSRFQNVEGAITNVLPFSRRTLGTGVDFSYASGEEGGFLISGGFLNGQDQAKLFDKRFLHARYKFFGAGVLSGAGGTMGNGYIGLDNSISVGLAVVNASDGISSAGDKTQWGVDVMGNYGNFTGGVAVGQNSDLDKDLYHVTAGYYIYPWLLASVGYDYDSSAEYGQISPSIRAYPRANVYVDFSFNTYTEDKDLSGTPLQQTAAIAGSIAF